MLNLDFEEHIFRISKSGLHLSIIIAVHSELKYLTNYPKIEILLGSYDDTPDDNTFVSQYKNLYNHFVYEKSNKNATTFWSGCGAIHRNVFLELGDLNQDYKHPTAEDIDLGFRLTWMGLFQFVNSRLLQN